MKSKIRSWRALEVFSVTGQRVRTLVDEVQEAGSYTAPFRLAAGGGARDLGAGVYLIRITAGERSGSMRVVGLN